MGELLFVDLLDQKVMKKVTTDIQVSDLALIQDDDQMSTSLLVSVKDLLLFFLICLYFSMVYGSLYTEFPHQRGFSSDIYF